MVFIIGVLSDWETRISVEYEQSFFVSSNLGEIGDISKFPIKSFSEEASYITTAL